MPAPLFRLAGPSDVLALVDLIERAYRGPETAGQWDSESHLLKGPRTSVSEIGALLTRPDSRFLAAEQDARIVGCALIQQTGVGAIASQAGVFGNAFSATPTATGPAGRHQEHPASPSAGGAYFGMFATDPKIRTVGLGKLVLAEAEGRARELFNARYMVMTVISVREQLIGWYERRGYRLTGKRLPFPFTETSGETTRDFDLVELRKDFA